MDYNTLRERIVTVLVVLAIVVTLLNIKNYQLSFFSLGIFESDVVSYSFNLNKALDLEIKGDWMAARSEYQQLVSKYHRVRDAKDWVDKIERMNIKILFSPIITPKSKLYEISRGDTLASIAEHFNTTTELIVESNDLENNIFAPGVKIKVWVSPFRIVVGKSKNTLTLQSGDEVIRTYVVSTGARNSSPSGKFKIANKLASFTLFNAEGIVPVDNPLSIEGSSWLGFDKRGYGIYGVNDSQSLGKQVTQGCILMSNHDISELYTIVPVGTEVTIVD